jgi:hypothetical protein
MAQRQALAEEMATKIMGMEGWSGHVTDTKELVAQSIRQMHQKATAFNEMVKSDVPEVMKISQCLIDFNDLYGIEFDRNERVFESVQEKIIKAVREKQSIGWGKHTTIRKCHPYATVKTSSIIKSIEVRPMRLDSETQAIIAGDSEVCDNESVVLDAVMNLFTRFVLGHVLAAGKMEVPEGFDCKGVGKHGDKMLSLHLQQANHLLGSYKKLAVYEKDGNRIMVHMLGTVDLIRHMVEEVKPHLSLSAAMLEVLFLKLRSILTFDQNSNPILIGKFEYVLMRDT